MLARYVEATGDTSILTRALPLAEVFIIYYIAYIVSSDSVFCIERTEMVDRQ